MIILASSSPRRKELLAAAGVPFKVIPAKNEVPIDTLLAPKTAVENVARAKAHEVFLSHKSDVVIGADTSVFACSNFLGKPASERDAYDMLRFLSGKSQQVITGVCVKSAHKEITFSVVSNVVFRKLSDKEILEYIKTGEPMDKAGAYAIQGKGSAFIKKTEGSFCNIVGLPVIETVHALKEVMSKSF